MRRSGIGNSFGALTSGGDYRPVRNVIQARRLARKLGFEEIEISAISNWTGQTPEEILGVLNAVLEPLVRLRLVDARLPMRLLVSMAGFAGEEYQATLARFEPETVTLFVQPDGGLWHPGLFQLAFDRVPRDTSTPHLQGVVYREAAHWLVYYHSPLLYNLLHDPTSELYHDEVANWSSRVSVYAGENALEFVAEVFAAIQTGVLIDTDVRAVLQKMLGDLVMVEVNP